MFDIIVEKNIIISTFYDCISRPWNIFFSMWHVYAYYPTYTKYKNNKIIYLFWIQLLHGECKITYHLSCPLFKKKKTVIKTPLHYVALHVYFIFRKKNLVHVRYPLFYIGFSWCPVLLSYQKKMFKLMKYK